MFESLRKFASELVGKADEKIQKIEIADPMMRRK